MQITQLIGANGKAVNNQIIIYDGDEITFQSYQSKIVTYNKVDKTLRLYGNMWDYSETTRKHFKTFINNFTYFRYSDRQQFLELINFEFNLKDRIKIIE